MAKEVQKVMDAAQKDLPKGSRMVLRGQVQTMQDSFVGLIGGLIFATCATLVLVPAIFSLMHSRQHGSANQPAAATAL